MRQRTIGYIGVIAIAIAPFAMAQTPQPQQPRPEPETSMQQKTTETRTATGRVVEVDADSLTVEATNGERMTFAVDRDLTQGPNPIRVGSQVRVEYRGEQELQVINVSPVSGGSTSAAPPSRPATADPVDDEDLDEEIAEEVDEMTDNDRPEAAARPQTAQPSQPARPGTAAVQVDPDDDDEELPGTASPLPLLLITGLSLLGGGLGLSARRRR